MGTLLALALLAAVAVTPGTDRPLRYVDGAHVVDVLPSAQDAAPGLTAVTLRYEDGRLFDASIDDTALVVAPDVAALERDFGVQRVELLLPVEHLWLVRGQAGENGAALAARLAGRVPMALPNLHLEHRIWSDGREPNDPRFAGQWFFDDLRMSEAWALGWGSEDVSVVVVDTGCDMQHEDLRDKLDPGRDVISNDDDPGIMSREEGANHGTACAGLIAASTDNEVGIAGACPLCRLRCVRLLPMNGERVPLSADVKAFQFAIDSGAAVVSNSWGFKDAIPVPGALAKAIEAAYDTGRDGLGAVIVFAAGNDNRLVEDDELLAVRGVVGVGAVTHYREATSYSNFGNAVDVSAPTGTLTTDLTGAYGGDPTNYTNQFGGTSSACPVVAGIAGLLVSAAPGKTSAEITDLLLGSVSPAPYATPDETGHDQLYGWGIVDPVQAMKDTLGIVDAPDAGTPAPDAGAPDDGSGGEAAGCGCAGEPTGLVALLALSLVRRRRVGAH